MKSFNRNLQCASHSLHLGHFVLYLFSGLRHSTFNKTEKQGCCNISVDWYTVMSLQVLKARDKTNGILQEGNLSWMLGGPPPTPAPLHTLTPTPTKTHTHTHTPLQIQLVSWSGWMGVHALRSRAEERETIVNPIERRMHRFDKIVFFSQFLSISPRPPCVHTTDSHRLTDIYLAVCPPSADVHSKHLSPLPPPEFKLHISVFFFLTWHIAQAFLHFWTGDLEMKTDFTFFCRTWIGIAYASGEETLTVSVKVVSAQLMYEGRGRADCLHWLEVNYWSERFYLKAQTFIRVKLRV